MTEQQLDRLNILDDFLQKKINRELYDLKKKSVKMPIDQELIKLLSLLKEYFDLDCLYELGCQDRIKQMEARIDWADHKAKTYRAALIERGVNVAMLAAYTKKTDFKG